MSTQTTPQTASSPKKSGGNIALIVVLAVLVIIMSGAALFLGYLYLGNASEVEKVRAEQIKIEQEKKELNDELINLQAQYDLLRELQNTSLDSLADVKDREIESLRMQIRSGSGNSGGSAKIKAEVAKLRSQLSLYEEELAALKKQNADLKNEKALLADELKTVTDDNNQLKSTNKNLSDKVDLAKQLKISVIQSYALRVAKNGNEKQTDKSKRANKIESCFTVFENEVVEKGDKVAYLIIKDPTGKLLGESAEKVLKIGENAISYTADKPFYFDGKNQKLCMEYTDVKDLPKGNYAITVYIENSLAARSTFELK
ncbi:MAG: hypothetical protein MH137_04290 [Flavobacteriales bacterium]|nr:hypothetical protein [Flavobacteriales bacterium]